uniref:PRELI/MSF1 domain-containing protein n=1 Tax=Meloidogyne enterolobii TaxID=390850 RepID=A0A6V7TQ87_MELEN|nr:unnamed protein product [Meloidogyne enterolobii]
MHLFEVPERIFDYTINQVVTIFYNRYPNSFSKHVISEDVISREIKGGKIITRKLIVKRGAGFLKSVPHWISRQTHVAFMPTLEESIFDVNEGTLITHTRNVSWTNTLDMTETCTYKKLPDSKSSVKRILSVKANCRFSNLVEQFLLKLFRKSTNKTLKGYDEKLIERFGHHTSTQQLHPTLGGNQKQLSERASDLIKKHRGAQIGNG